MPRSITSIIALGLILLLPKGLLAAAESNSPEMRMREQLRSTMLQLRDSQTQTATLQASQAESDQKNKALTVQVEALTKRLAADKDASDKSIADLKSKLENRDAKVAELGDSLEKWKTSQKQAAELAAAKESQRAKLAADVIGLQQHVADQQVRNLAMFKLGSEILVRYEKFGLGEALLAREPFTGISRVKLRTLVQDYQDKLVDQKIKPSDEKAPAPKAAAAPTKSSQGTEKKAAHDRVQANANS